MKEEKRGYCCARVSTTRQGDVHLGSLIQQENRFKGWEKQVSQETGINYKIVKFIREERSGRKEKHHLRTEFHAVIGAIERREIDFVLFEDIKRMSRWPKMNFTLVELAEENGVEVWFADTGKFDPNDNSCLIKFGIDSVLGQAESNTTKERVTRKQRQAMISNGKDVSTNLILGLDPDPNKSCFYIRNEEEIKIVLDITNNFLKLRSYKELENYCNSKGYRTKKRITSDRVDNKGNRIKARTIGGDQFKPKTLKTLLESPKLRGYNLFIDTYNQFPDKQGEEKKVTWYYAHGRVYSEELVQKIDETILKLNKTRNRKGKDGTNYLLSGILKDKNGTNYHGASEGKYKYYRNKSLSINVRIRKEEIERAVIGRIKEYVEKNGLLESIMTKALNDESTGVPSLKLKLTELRKREKKLLSEQKIVSNSIRQLSVESLNEMKQVYEMVLGEKNKIDVELGSVKVGIEAVSNEIIFMKHSFEGENAQKRLKAVWAKFGKGSSNQQKGLIRAIIPQITILPDNKLQLHINPCHADLNKRVGSENWTQLCTPVGPQGVGHKNKMCHGGNYPGIRRKWRG